MINRYSYRAGTAVFVRVGGVWQQGRPEENRSLWQTAEMPAEISEAHLRLGMDPIAPVPLASELQANGMAINKAN